MTQSATTHERYAIITGGGSGLGRELCQVFAADGFCIAIVGIHREGLEETLSIVQRGGGSGRVELCDVTDPAAWKSLSQRLQVDWPRLDLLINNAGMFSSGFVGRLGLDEVERVLRLNLFGAIYGCEIMTPWLIESTQRSPGTTRPHLVNIASIYAYLSPPGMSAYNISKAGVVSLSETLRGELAANGIGVTVACPGPMPTRFVERAHFESDAFRRMTDAFVCNSTLQPREVALAIRRAVHRNQLYCMMGRRERWYWRLKRMLPTTVLRRVAIRVRRELKVQ